MVAPVKHDCVLCQAVLVELGQQLSQPSVVVRDIGVISGYRAAHFFRIRQIGRNLDVFRRDRELFVQNAFLPHPTFVRSPEVEDGKEGLVGIGTVPPMPAPAAIIPGGQRGIKLIVSLAVVCTVIARATEVFRKALHVVRDHGLVVTGQGFVVVA